MFKIPEELHSSLLATVIDFRIDSKWIIPMLLADRFTHTTLQITQTICSTSNDKLICQDSTDGMLSLKDTYHCISPAACPTNWCKLLWFSSIPPSKSFTIWFCRNQFRFEDKYFNLSQALVEIKMAITLFGNNSKVRASSSHQEFSILRSLNVSINHMKAPTII
ncbi:hypothetical protein Lal_00045533 [Lupinus albus]|nr:hypothetical protein Lal_00045533 [Lupinus albus]